MIGFIRSIKGNTVGLLCTHTETWGISWPAQQTAASRCVFLHSPLKKEKTAQTPCSYKYSAWISKPESVTSHMTVSSYSWAPTGAYDQTVGCVLISHDAPSWSTLCNSLLDPCVCVCVGGGALLPTVRVKASSHKEWLFIILRLRWGF